MILNQKSAVLGTEVRQQTQIGRGAFLVAITIAFLSGCSFHSRPVTTTTTTGASIAIGTPPVITEHSHRNQINTFVAYFAAKGFPKNDLSAVYYPSGQIKTFHYCAIYRNSRVEASIDAPKHTMSLSTEEGIDPDLTITSTTTTP